jgi:hypothetical protein
MHSVGDEIERLCDAVGLRPYKLYSASEAAQFLSVEAHMLEHLTQIGELERVPGRKAAVYLGAHLAQYRADKGLVAPETAHADEPLTRGGTAFDEGL